VQDTKTATVLDVGSDFYLTPAVIGKNRALASVDKLAELNHYVSVSATDKPITPALLTGFNTLVVTEPLPEAEIIALNTLCREKKISFIACETSGVFGFVFNDFGDSFLVTDPTGEQRKRFLIESVTQANPGIVQCPDGVKHGLNDGDRVTFEEISGMTELNEGEFPVTVITFNKFSIGDTSRFHPYEFVGSGGYGNQIVPPTTVTFKPYAAALAGAKADTLVVAADQVSWGRDEQVTLAFATAHRLLEKYKTLNTVPFESVLAAARDVNGSLNLVDTIDENLLRLLARQYGYPISPMASVIGGIVGQEILKSVSGKFLPVVQFLGISYIESLPPDTTFSLQNDRYDPYRVVFGDAELSIIQKLRYFMIGSGAIGCELLKNWAMMGVATSAPGDIILTDMDRIEKSNLARQFLFRDRDIGSNKSSAAAAAIRVMNPSTRITAQTNRLDETTRDIYDDAFYLSLDGVCNALDNITARLFSDSLCVHYGKPLLESGTLGPKANFQIVVPGLTDSYGSTSDPDEDEIPACTLHNFPAIIDHCCQWARDFFAGLFEEGPAELAKYLREPGYVDDLRKQGNSVAISRLQQFVDALAKPPRTPADCAAWARDLFETLFNKRIQELLHLFPLDHVNDAGQLFWTGSKRPPSPQPFDPANENHAAFVVAAATIYGRTWGLPPAPPPELVRAAAAVKVEPWAPQPQPPVADEAQELAKLEELVRSADELKGRFAGKVTAEEFEKDDD
jgi:ubiquitin-activating enzyme E1